VEHVAYSPAMKDAIANWDSFVLLRDRRQIKDRPFVGTAQEDAHQIILMQPLHNDDDGAILLVIEPRQQRVQVPIENMLALFLRKRRESGDRIVNDN
jgi:hypothetical protein